MLRFVLTDFAIQMSIALIDLHQFNYTKQLSRFHNKQARHPRGNEQNQNNNKKCHNKREKLFSKWYASCTLIHVLIKYWLFPCWASMEQTNDRNDIYSNST